MRCPHCDVALLLSERQGVEIDYCPECRGVWLDRGELDKIVERSHDEFVGATAAPPSRPMAPPPGPAGPDRERSRDDDRYRSDRDRDGDRARGDRDRDGDRDRYRSDDDRRRYDDRDRQDPKYDKKKKRKSFLEDIFDF